MATNEKRRDKSGEMNDVTTWFRVTLWRNQAENAAKYLTKGSSVYIEGRLRLDEWTDRDGNVSTYSWIFPGGTPSKSPLQSPGPVSFAEPGVYVVSMTAIDNVGVNDPSPPTRRVVVKP